MADMHALIRLMREVEDLLAACMRCGMCQAVCPLYAETGLEADVARGKLALLDGLLHEIFERPDSVAERLNKCLLCGSCEANCPSGVRVMDIFIKARAILTDFSGLPTAERIILKGLLARPALFDRIAYWSTAFQKLLARPADDLLGTSCARVASPLIGDRHFKPLAAEPFHRSGSVLDTPAGTSGYRVAFFVGCLIDKIYPQVAHAVVDVCRRLGVGLFIPRVQGCCGIPALSAGDTDTFQRLVRHNLNQFGAAACDYLVTACATCAATIKKLWPLMLPEDGSGLRADAVRMADKTLDISQFLIDKRILKAPAPAAEEDSARIAVTYHDPCHLKKTLGVFTQPRALLRATQGYRLVEMGAADQCCGMGGSFGLKYNGISSRIGRRKRSEILASGCRVVATSCPACMLQITDALSRAGDAVDVKHVIELYAQSS
jgi:glycolate dehydrogenase iron-sulfur subunit